MQRISSWMAAGALIASVTAVRAAEPPVYPLDQIVVTAARVRQPISSTLQSTTVITARDVANSGQSTLLGLLQRLGGVEIGANGGAGQPSGVFMRGANSAQTLVLIDGLRVGSATTGAAIRADLDTTQALEQAE